MSLRLLWLVGFIAVPALAQDAFEVQVYDSETAPAGAMGVEFHANYFAGSERTTHLTLEPHLGLSSWCEVGMYFTSAISPDGRYDFAGVKARFKARWPHKLSGVVGLALNTELAFGGGTYDESGIDWELRPVIDAELGRVYLAVNPIIATVLTGPGAGQASIEPALKAAFRLLEQVSVGVEYYLGLGTFRRLAPFAEQTHRLFGAIDLKAKAGRADLGLNLGVGAALVGAPGLVVKLIFSVDFD